MLAAILQADTLSVATTISAQDSATGILNHPIFSGVGGSLVGAAGAALVALWVLRKQIQNEKERDEARQRGDYANTLFLVLIVFSHHIRISVMLLGELQSLRNLSMQKGRLFAETLEIRFQVDELFKLVSRLSTYWNYDPSLMSMLFNYTMSIEHINRLLNLDSAKALCLDAEKPISLDIALSSTVDVIRKDVERMDLARERIYGALIHELRGLNFARVNVPTFDTISDLAKSIDESLK